MKPTHILKLEGLTLFLVSLYIFSTTNYSWFVYIIFFLAPDISAIGDTNPRPANLWNPPNEADAGRKD